jgi:hypothetical protein
VFHGGAYPELAANFMKILFKLPNNWLPRHEKKEGLVEAVMFEPDGRAYLREVPMSVKSVVSHLSTEQYRHKAEPFGHYIR